MIQSRSGISIAFLGLVVGFASCSQERFLYLPAEPVAQKAQPSPSPAPKPSPSTPPKPVDDVFQKLQPAVAVRGAACLMCHAKINADMITDFGYGDPFFLHSGGGEISMGSFFFNHGLGSWQTGTVHGNLIIPSVTLTRPTYDRQMNTVDPGASLPSMSLAALLRMPQVATNYGGTPPTTAGVPGTPMSAGIPSIVEKSKIYIGAPTEEDILSQAPLVAASSIGYWKAGDRSINLPSPTGLKIAMGVSYEYVTHAGPVFRCAGDYVIHGSLFLNHVTIDTDTNGCRLYVTGTVNTQGPIQFTTRAKNENLQITSARAILMGFGVETLNTRMMVTGGYTWVLPNMFTRGLADIYLKHVTMLGDAMNLAPSLEDAGSNHVAFERLLLNAPEIHGRYLGPFKGSIIGELVLFRLGEFDFTFDDHLREVRILPLLKKSILEVVD